MFGLKKKHDIETEMDRLSSRILQIEHKEEWFITPSLKHHSDTLNTIKKEFQELQKSIQRIQSQINMHKRQELCPHYNIYFETDGWIKGCLDCFKVLKAYQTEKEYNDEVIEHHRQANLEMEKKRHKND